jgi:hypothetical protein
MATKHPPQPPRTVRRLRPSALRRWGIAASGCAAAFALLTLLAWLPLDGCSACEIASAAPAYQTAPAEEPTPDATATATAEPTATAESTATAEPTATESPTVMPMDTPTEEPSPTATPSPEPSATPTAMTTETPTEAPTETPTETPAATATVTETLTPAATATTPPTETPTVDPTATPLATPLDTPTATAAPRLLITELMIDPDAVGDTAGEWLEVHNIGNTPVNLAGWSLGTDERIEHTIIAESWLPPNGYAILARNSDPSLNGGVIAAYRYASIMLANTSDTLVLRAPDGSIVDAVAWGAESGLTVRAGASLERTNLDDPAQWVVATQPLARLCRRLRQSGRGLHTAFRSNRHPCTDSNGNGNDSGDCNRHATDSADRSNSTDCNGCGYGRRDSQCDPNASAEPDGHSHRDANGCSTHHNGYADPCTVRDADRQCNCDANGDGNPVAHRHRHTDPAANVYANPCAAVVDHGVDDQPYRCRRCSWGVVRAIQRRWYGGQSARMAHHGSG